MICSFETWLAIGKSPVGTIACDAVPVRRHRLRYRQRLFFQYFVHLLYNKPKPRLA